MNLEEYSEIYKEHLKKAKEFSEEDSRIDEEIIAQYSLMNLEAMNGQ